MDGRINVEQAAMVEAQLFAALGKIVPLGDGDWWGKLFVDRFKALDFLAHEIDLGQQLHHLLG
ncbi:hypothetical protein HBN71_16950 [Pseudomonas lundensis]|uniref:hypothetical protein n=1 Tax=Pseudomonas sp. Bout1 TaxID=3048600 RepID=UPI001473A331|nr:hypothetical protein [Pseudomonas lundensis]